jgi:hypothetical protein
MDSNKSTAYSVENGQVSKLEQYRIKINRTYNVHSWMMVIGNMMAVIQDVNKKHYCWDWNLKFKPQNTKVHFITTSITVKE